VHVNDEDDDKQLCVSHTPSMLPDECRRVGTMIRSEHLSLEQLLMTTIEVRTRTKLKELSYGIQRFIEGKCRWMLLSLDKLNVHTTSNVGGFFVVPKVLVYPAL